MSNGNDQRIRHVAIVLQSLDATTAKRLLSQLPPEIARLVKNAIVHLGKVSPEERAKANASVGEIFGSLGNSLANNSSATPKGHNDAFDASPASELLSLQSTPQIDQVSFSKAAQSQTVPSTQTREHTTSFEPPPTFAPAYSSRPNEHTHTHNQSPATPSHPSIASQPAARTPSIMGLHSMDPESLAEILMSERPIVVATVLNQLPIERATQVVQRLPMQVATATLAMIPHLHLTDPEVLRDIQSEIQRKIGAYQQPKQAAAEGLSKLQAILSAMPEDQKPFWTNAIANTNPAIAGSMGWTPPSMPRVERTERIQHTIPSQPIQPTTPPSPVKLAPSEEAEGFVVAYKTQVNSGQSNPTKPARDQVEPASSSEQKVAPERSAVGKQAVEEQANTNSGQQAFEELVTLSDEDFVAVLHACKPAEVLLALMGASKRMLARVERLVPPRDLKRLRERLSNPGPIALRDIDRAQSAIAAVAEAMLNEQNDGQLSHASFTAAA